jgi:hypothetical protein
MLKGLFSKKSSDELRSHEWIAVAILLLFMCMLSKLAWNAPDSRWPERDGKPVATPQEQIVITLSGAIEKEGRYHFPKGVTLGQVLAAVPLKENADLRKFNLAKELKRGQKIRIPYKKQNKR